MIYVTGDMHGEQERFEDSKLRKLKKNDYLIICGDFGFLWDSSASEKAFLKKLSRKRYKILFVDGTHENFTLLNAYPVTEWNGGKVHMISNNVIHLMRGQVFTIEGKKIFTMGGGVSNDIDIRYENNAWSKDEIPTKSELMEGVKNLEKAHGDIDIVITHEPPARIKEFLLLTSPFTTTVTAVNRYLEEMSGVCDYRHWYFGSLHIDKFISKAHISLFRNIVNAETGEKV